jgi:hypothetical protein
VAYERAAFPSVGTRKKAPRPFDMVVMNDMDWLDTATEVAAA